MNQETITARIVNVHTQQVIREHVKFNNEADRLRAYRTLDRLDNAYGCDAHALEKEPVRWVSW